MIKKLLQVITLGCLLLISSVTHSQVTIGKAEKPASGALLDLKNLDTPGANGETANKGLMLPRVELSDVSKLYPMLPAGYDPGEDAKHSGLVVYNMSDVGFDFCPGIYMWNTNKWTRVPQPCNKAIFTPASLMFYASALTSRTTKLETSFDGAKVAWTDGGGINWQQYPNDLTRAVATNFTFLPQPIVVGSGTRTSKQTAIVVLNGKTTTHEIDIEQLDRDPLFIDRINNSPYPSTAGTYDFTIDSETEWHFVSVADLKSALAATFDNTSKGKGVGTVYNFTLNTNNTWDRPTVTYTPASSNLDFVGKLITITQENVAPSIVLDKASIAFDNAETPVAQSVQVTSNAKWKITTSGDWDKVVSAPAPTTEYGNHTYHTTTDTPISFSPKQWLGGIGAAAANTTHTATATFTTSDHSPAVADAKNLTLTRVVPLYFTSFSAGANSIGRVGGNVTVIAATNGAWKATPEWGTASAAIDPSAYGNKNATVNIEPNTTWSTTTSPVDRTVSISSVYGLTSASMPTSGGSETITQPGYYISDLSRNLPTPAAIGGTLASVTITGATPNINVRSAYYTTDASVVTQLTVGTVAAGESGARTSSNINIPSNALWTARSVVCQYQDPRDNNTWTTIGAAESQAGYAITAASATAVTASAGGTCTVTLAGYRPAVAIRAVNTQSGIVLGTNVAASTGAASTGTIAIPANTGGAARTITIQYNHGTAGWTNITSWSQTFTLPFLNIPGLTFYIATGLTGPVTGPQLKTTCAARPGGWVAPNRDQIVAILERYTSIHYMTYNTPLTGNEKYYGGWPVKNASTIQIPSQWAIMNGDNVVNHYTICIRAK